MTKQNQTPLSAAEVRAWVREQKRSAFPKGTDFSSIYGKNDSGVVRGRIAPVFYTAASEALGRPYAEKSVAEQKSIPLVLTRRDKNGKSRGKVTLDVPVAEVRSLGGAPARGRISSAVRAKAVEALEQQRGW